MANPNPNPTPAPEPAAAPAGAEQALAAHGLNLGEIIGLLGQPEFRAAIVALIALARKLRG